MYSKSWVAGNGSNTKYPSQKGSVIKNRDATMLFPELIKLLVVARPSSLIACLTQSVHDMPWGKATRTASDPSGLYVDPKYLRIP